MYMKVLLASVISSVVTLVVIEMLTHRSFTVNFTVTDKGGDNV